MRQRLPGQLTRVQRFAFQILVHVGDSESDSEWWGGGGSRRGAEGKPRPAQGCLLTESTAIPQVMHHPLPSFPALTNLPDDPRRCCPAGVLEGEVRRTFGNNPDVSKALRALAEQGEHSVRSMLVAALVPVVNCSAGIVTQLLRSAFCLFWLWAGCRSKQLQHNLPHICALPSQLQPPPAPCSPAFPPGKLVRSGEGGRGTPFAYTATAKGQGAVAEARQKLQADAELLSSAAAGGASAGEAAAAAPAAGEAPAGEAAA